MTCFNYFLVFPEVLTKLNKHAGPYEILVTRKDNQKTLGRGAPLFSSFDNCKQCDRNEYRQLRVCLVRNRDLTETIDLQQLVWRVKDLQTGRFLEGSDLEKRVRKEPFLDSRRLKPYNRTIPCIVDPLKSFSVEEDSSSQVSSSVAPVTAGPHVM